MLVFGELNWFRPIVFFSHSILMAIYSIGFRCCHFRCSYQADMHPIVTSRASTSQHNAIVPLVFAGVLTDTALNLPIPAQEANQIAVNNSGNIFSAIENDFIQYFSLVRR